MHRTFLFSFALLLVASCSPAHYAYRRIDTVFVDGTAYHSDIRGESHFVTGFSPDIGRQRVNVTDQANNSSSLFQIDLPSGAALWIRDEGLGGSEEDMAAGVERRFTPPSWAVLWVDDPKKPRKLRPITTPCARDPDHRACLSETVVTYAPGKKGADQKRATIEDEYRQPLDQTLSIFGNMVYFICPRELWQQNAKFSRRVNDSHEAGQIIEPPNANWVVEESLISPCGLQNPAGHFEPQGNGLWRASTGNDEIFRYLGKAKKGETTSIGNLSEDKINALFFHEVHFPWNGLRFTLPAAGQVSIQLDSRTGDLYILGFNRYKRLKLAEDE
jgi:hypothetical protein